MHSLVALLKVLFEATPEAWAPLGHIIHIITSDTRRNLKKASLCQKPQNSLFFVFLVDTLLIICFASCGSNVCDDPLPPAPPPPFVVLEWTLLFSGQTMDTHPFRCSFRFMIPCFTFARA